MSTVTVAGCNRFHLSVAVPAQPNDCGRIFFAPRNFVQGPDATNLFAEHGRGGQSNAALRVEPLVAQLAKTEAPSSGTNAAGPNGRSSARLSP